MDSHCSACETHLVFYQSSQVLCPNCHVRLCSSCRAIKVKLEQMGAAKPGTCNSCNMVVAMKSKAKKIPPDPGGMSSAVITKPDPPVAQQKVNKQGTSFSPSTPPTGSEKTQMAASWHGREKQIILSSGRGSIMQTYPSASAIGQLDSQRLHSSQSESSAASSTYSEHNAIMHEGQQTRLMPGHRKDFDTETTGPLASGTDPQTDSERKDFKIGTGSDQNENAALKLQMREMLLRKSASKTKVSEPQFHDKHSAESVQDNGLDDNTNLDENCQERLSLLVEDQSASENQSVSPATTFDLDTRTDISKSWHGKEANRKFPDGLSSTTHSLHQPNKQMPSHQETSDLEEMHTTFLKDVQTNRSIDNLSINSVETENIDTADEDDSLEHISSMTSTSSEGQYVQGEGHEDAASSAEIRETDSSTLQEQDEADESSDKSDVTCHPIVLPREHFPGEQLTPQRVSHTITVNLSEGDTSDSDAESSTEVRDEQSETSEDLGSKVGGRASTEESKDQGFDGSSLEDLSIPSESGTPQSMKLSRSEREPVQEDNKNAENVERSAEIVEEETKVVLEREEHINHGRDVNTEDEKDEHKEYERFKYEEKEGPEEKALVDPHTGLESEILYQMYQDSRETGSLEQSSIEEEKEEECDLQVNSLTKDVLALDQEGLMDTAQSTNAGKTKDEIVLSNDEDSDRKAHFSVSLPSDSTISDTKSTTESLHDKGSENVNLKTEFSLPQDMNGDAGSPDKVKVNRGEESSSPLEDKPKTSEQVDQEKYQLNTSLNMSGHVCVPVSDTGTTGKSDNQQQTTTADVKPGVRKLKIVDGVTYDETSEGGNKPVVFVADVGTVYVGEVEDMDIPEEEQRFASSKVSSRRDGVRVGDESMTTQMLSKTGAKSSDVTSSFDGKGEDPVTYYLLVKTPLVDLTSMEFSDSLCSGLGQTPEDESNLCDNLLPSQIQILSRYREIGERQNRAGTHQSVQQPSTSAGPHRSADRTTPSDSKSKGKQGNIDVYQESVTHASRTGVERNDGGTRQVSDGVSRKDDKIHNDESGNGKPDIRVTVTEDKKVDQVHDSIERVEGLKTRATKQGYQEYANNENSKPSKSESRALKAGQAGSTAGGSNTAAKVTHGQNIGRPASPVLVLRLPNTSKSESSRVSELEKMSPERKGSKISTEKRPTLEQVWESLEKQKSEKGKPIPLAVNQQKAQKTAAAYTKPNQPSRTLPTAQKLSAANTNPHQSSAVQTEALKKVSAVKEEKKESAPKETQEPQSSPSILKFEDTTEQADSTLSAEEQKQRQAAQKLLMMQNMTGTENAPLSQARQPQNNPLLQMLQMTGFMPPATQGSSSSNEGQAREDFPHRDRYPGMPGSSKQQAAMQMMLSSLSQDGRTGMENKAVRKRKLVQTLTKLLGLPDFPEERHGGEGDEQQGTEDTATVPGAAAQTAESIMFLLQMIMMTKPYGSTGPVSGTGERCPNPFLPAYPWAGATSAYPGGQSSGDTSQTRLGPEQPKTTLLGGGNSSSHPLETGSGSIETLINSVLDVMETDTSQQDPTNTEEHSDERRLNDILQVLSMNVAAKGSGPDKAAKGSGPNKAAKGSGPDKAATSQLPAFLTDAVTKHAAQRDQRMNRIVQLMDEIIALRSGTSDSSGTSVKDKAVEALDLLQQYTEAFPLVEPGKEQPDYVIINGLSNILLIFIEEENKKEQERESEPPTSMSGTPAQSELAEAGMSSSQQHANVPPRLDPTGSGSKSTLLSEENENAFDAVETSLIDSTTTLVELSEPHQSYPYSNDGFYPPHGISQTVQYPTNNSKTSAAKPARKQGSKPNKNAVVSKTSNLKRSQSGASQKVPSTSSPETSVSASDKTPPPLPDKPPPSLNRNYSNQLNHQWSDNPAYGDNMPDTNYQTGGAAADQEWAREGILGERPPDTEAWQYDNFEGESQENLQNRQIKSQTEPKTASRTFGQPWSNKPMRYNSDELTRLLDTAAQSLDLYVHRVPSDGNCMFNSIVDQLRIRGIFKYNHMALRLAAVKYLRHNPYHEDGTHKENFLLSGKKWDCYLRQMRCLQEWGDHLVLSAVADVLGTKIHVLTVSNTGTTDAYILPASGETTFFTPPLTMGLKEEYHFESLRHHCWIDHLKQRAVEPTQCIKKEKPTLAFAAMLAEGHFPGNARSSDTESSDSDDLETGEKDLEALENYSSQCLVQADSFWDPLADLSTPHISFLLRLMFSTDRVFLKRPGKYLSIDEETERNTPYGECLEVGTAFEFLDASIVKQEHYCDSHRYHHVCESYDGELYFVLKDSKVVVSGKANTKANKVDLVADDTSCPPGYVRLLPVTKDVWSNQLTGDGKGKFYLKKIKIQKPKRRPNSNTKKAEKEKKERVAAFCCEKWPGVAADWVGRSRKANWPPKSTIKEVIKTPCHVIPATSDLELEEGTLEHDTLWQYSFASAEMYIVSQLSGWQRHCFFVLQFLLDEFMESATEVLSPQNLKSLLFLACEEIPMLQWEFNPGACILYMLDMLIKFTSDGHLPCYFMPAVDLLTHFPRYAIELAHRDLVAMRKFFCVFFVVYLQRFLIHHNDVFTGILDNVLQDARQLKRDKQLGQSISDCFVVSTVEVAKCCINSKGYLQGCALFQKAYQEMIVPLNQQFNQSHFSAFVNERIQFGLRPLNQWLFMFYAEKICDLQVDVRLLESRAHTTLGEVLGEAAQDISMVIVPYEVFEEEFEFLCDFCDLLQQINFFNQAESILRYTIGKYANKIVEAGPDKQRMNTNNSNNAGNTNLQLYMRQDARNIAVCELYWKLWRLYLNSNQKEKFQDMVESCLEQCDKICRRNEYHSIMSICNQLGMEEMANGVKERITDRLDDDQHMNALD